MKPLMSVIVCTHNPRKDYLNSVITGLKNQTLSVDSWELLLIDNKSDNLLSLEVDLSWHPHALHIREEALGLTNARLRGIKEFRTELIVFVDDDNLLDSDYLEKVCKISDNWPFIGAWGGQIRPKFEITPPDWVDLYLPYLAVREFNRDKWSNLFQQYETIPCGAGMCVRRGVAEQYVHLVRHDSRRLALGRTGKRLVSSEDNDLALTACDLGLGTGQFTDLKLTHLIPANRLEEEYLVRLREGAAYSDVILDSLRGKLPSHISWKTNLSEHFRSFLMSPSKRQFYRAKNRGRNLAIQEIHRV